MAAMATQVLTLQVVVVIGPVQVRVAMVAMAAAVPVQASARAAAMAEPAAAVAQAIGMITVNRMMRKMEPMVPQVQVVLPLMAWAISM